LDPEIEGLTRLGLGVFFAARREKQNPYFFLLQNEQF